MTLIGTAYNLAPIGAWFPPFIETAIAASIFYMAIKGKPPKCRGSQWTRRWREKDSNPRSPFLDTHLLNALALGAAGLAYVSYEQLCCYAGGESRLSR